MGLTGLYETLLAIYRKNKIENIREAQELGLEIIRTIRKKCDRFSEENNLNYQLIALPENYDKEMFIDIDQIIHGKIKGVTDKEHYTNSFKIKTNNLEEKIKWEAPFHKYTNAGHIFVLETKDYDNNITKLEEVLNALQKEDIGFVEVEREDD